MESHYWRGRLFRNTFTYKGQARSVNGWSVKIQHFGHRQTFSLKSGDRSKAALEAGRLYRTIVAKGWGAVWNRRFANDPDARAAAPKAAPGGAAGTDAGYWKKRLLRRKYPEKTKSNSASELSVRIEHKGISHYFPLGTDREQPAAIQARKIFQTVLNEGWEEANRQFRRELTIAFHWASNPLAWTYTTLQTQSANPATRMAVLSARRKSALQVAIVEPEIQIARALASAVSYYPAFTCATLSRNANEALREIPPRRPHLALISQNLPDMAGAACGKVLQSLAPHCISVLFSVHEDSEQLFKSTPGGATGYLLKRTLPHRMLEPIAGTLQKGMLSREQVSFGIREYFQSLFAPLPAGDPFHEMGQLTPREHEILNLLTKGYVDKEIADSLHISIWTVHGHVKNIFEKLGVHTRTEAVVKYLHK